MPFCPIGPKDEVGPDQSKRYRKHSPGVLVNISPNPLGTATLGLYVGFANAVGNTGTIWSYWVGESGQMSSSLSQWGIDNTDQATLTLP